LQSAIFKGFWRRRAEPFEFFGLQFGLQVEAIYGGA
jgi:hypothetical protein